MSKRRLAPAILFMVVAAIPPLASGQSSQPKTAQDCNVHAKLCRQKGADPSNCRDRPPKVVRQVSPTYPEEAQRAGITRAVVVLRVVIATDGRAQCIRVEKPAG